MRGSDWKYELYVCDSRLDCSDMTHTPRLKIEMFYLKKDDPVSYAIHLQLNSSYINVYTGHYSQLVNN